MLTDSRDQMTMTIKRDKTRCSRVRLRTRKISGDFCLCSRHQSVQLCQLGCRHASLIQQCRQGWQCAMPRAERSLQEGFTWVGDQRGDEWRGVLAFPLADGLCSAGSLSHSTHKTVVNLCVVSVNWYKAQICQHVEKSKY